jgi:TonB-dependent SusC/RagA subfamily outer membrane receptor
VDKIWQIDLLTNIQQALQGLVSNLVIAPNIAGGADMAMSILGLASFEGSTGPFVLVDGIPMNINDIDPNDIENIYVLKDASSTSIYAARAAYGVILITTKKGSIGSRISYSTNDSLSHLLVRQNVLIKKVVNFLTGKQQR